MASKGIYTVHYRRKREKKTDYKKRMAYLKSGLPRLVVRRFNKNILAQVVVFQTAGDKVLLSVHSSELKKYGWKYNTGNIPASYLVGYLAGKRSPEKTMILDLGLHTPIKGNRIFALLKGALDAGLDIPNTDTKLPSQDRLLGKHIAQYADKVTDDKVIFAQYKKSKVDPKEIEAALKQTKDQIDSGLKNAKED